MNDLIYEHKTQGLTRFSFLFLIAAIALVLAGSNFGAPIYLYMPFGFFILFFAWWFMSNPNLGCNLTKTELTIWTNKDVTRIPLSDIASVEPKKSATVPDNFTIIMRDSSTHSMMHLHFGRSEEFASALEQVGITVTRAG